MWMESGTGRIVVVAIKRFRDDSPRITDRTANEQIRWFVGSPNLFKTQAATAARARQATMHEVFPIDVLEMSTTTRSEKAHWHRSRTIRALARGVYVAREFWPESILFQFEYSTIHSSHRAASGTAKPSRKGGNRHA
jgi:hypothetical protein